MNVPLRPRPFVPAPNTIPDPVQTASAAGTFSDPAFSMVKRVTIKLSGDEAAAIGLAPDQTVMITCTATGGGPARAPEGVVVANIQPQVDVGDLADRRTILLQVVLRGAVVGWATLPAGGHWMPQFIGTKRIIALDTDWPHVVFRYGRLPKQV